MFFAMTTFELWRNVPEARDELILSAGLIGGVILASIFISLIWKKVLQTFISKTKTKLDNFIVTATVKAFPVFIAALGIYIVLVRLGQLEWYAGRYWVTLLNNGAYVALVLSGTWLTYKFVNAIFEWYLAEVAHRTESQLDDAFLPVLQKVAKLVMFFVAATIILSHFEVDVTSLVAGAGVASLALALAAQDSLSNMVSGFIIMLDRPFRVGDMIELGNGKMGTVHEIGLRSTKLMTFDYTLLIIPNNEIAKSEIINYMYPDIKFKVRMTFDVAYGTDVKKVKQILIDICKSHSNVLKDPEPCSYFMEFSSSSLKVRVDCWVAKIDERFTTMEELRMTVKDRFEEAKIEVPFQTQTVYVRQEK